MKNQKGITLIALIVTIIVLIILAGISINLLLGENGLITRAKNAKTVYTQSELEERVNLAYLDYKLQKETGKSVSLESILGNIEGVTVTALAAETSNDTFCIEKDGLKVTVNTQGDVSQGEVKVWKGANDIKCPRIENGTWYIDEPAQLNFLAYYVNNGCSITEPEGEETEYTKDLTGYTNGATITMTSSTMIELTNDLDMGARKAEGTKIEDMWETEANEALNWTIIGSKQANVENKLGKFNGNNHVIKGVYLNKEKEDNGYGIFGNSNTIENLSIKNSYIKGGNLTGGITGKVLSGEELKNCHNINATVVLRSGNYYCVGRSCCSMCWNKGL